MIHETKPVVTTVDPTKLPYRQGVGICLFNGHGQVLIAERRERRGAWQMPQGGVQKNEHVHLTVMRELREEIGTDDADIIAQLPEKLRYEFPDWLQYRGGIFRGKYRGQEQDWFALRFKGRDSDVDLSGEHDPENPEFVAWRWAELAEVPPLIVDFKRPVYDAIVVGFQALADAIKRGDMLPVWAPSNR